MLSEFWLRLRAFIFRRKFDRDLEDEIAFHLAMKQGKNGATDSKRYGRTLVTASGY